MTYNTIGEAIIKKMSETLSMPGYGIGYQDDETKKVVKSIDCKNNELQYIGIDDSKGDYFYIRMLDDNVTAEDLNNNQSTGSCATAQREKVNLTLVAIIECTEIEPLERRLKAALIASARACRLPCTKNIKIRFRKTLPLAKTIIKRETPDAMKIMNTKIKLIAFDFELTYIFDYCSI